MQGGREPAEEVVNHEHQPAQLPCLQCPCRDVSMCAAPVHIMLLFVSLYFAVQYTAMLHFKTHRWCDWLPYICMLHASMLDAGVKTGYCGQDPFAHACSESLMWLTKRDATLYRILDAATGFKAAFS